MNATTIATVIAGAANVDAAVALLRIIAPDFNGAWVLVTLRGDGDNFMDTYLELAAAGIDVCDDRATLGIVLDEFGG